MRCDERNNVLLQLKMPKEVQKMVGIKFSDETTAIQIPLVRFANSMAISRPDKLGHLTIDKKEVVTMFTMLSTVALDYLITGLI